MRKSYNPISRRDFLKLAALGAGALAFRPFAKQDLPECPQSDHLGRVTVGKVEVFATGELQFHHHSENPVVVY